MKFITVVLFVYLSTVTYGKSTKKFKDESAVLNKKLVGKAKTSPPAIIAIEIVDSNENKTSKNSKRTINNSLGYGYQSSPKYQVYKYSQHNIPPYKGPPNVLRAGIKSHQYDFQKSVSYNLPTQTHKSQNLNQYYEPGTTLYSTVNNQGQVGGLSSHLPQIPEPQVPVIILRVYANQLNDPSAVLHPNLPESHPLSSVVNSIDVQSLLTKYVQNLLLKQPQQQQQHHYQPQFQYQQVAQPEYQYQQPAQPDYHYQQTVQPEYQYPQSAQPEYHYQYEQQPQYQNYDTHSDDGLLTHENYPKDTHTRVIFHTDKNKIQSNHQTETKTIQIQVPEGAYSAVQVQTPHMQYGYTSPGEDYTQQNYYQQSSNLAPNYYYQTVPDSGYQQVQDQQQVEYVPSASAPAQQETLRSYHAHQKRSKKANTLRMRQEKLDDVIKLQPIKA